MLPPLHHLNDSGRHAKLRFTEYNLNFRVMDGVRAAIDHINYYGSAHSDSTEL